MQTSGLNTHLAYHTHEPYTPWHTHEQLIHSQNIHTLQINLKDKRMKHVPRKEYRERIGRAAQYLGKTNL